ncbi:thiopeptide-type bacteriocin biosynthesis domain protein [Staphylococcus agnetis]|uniref:lantibiotic dehydratase n=1 Tax=Staphylococcus agnetis TaxID=985762 RepID=UPI000E0346F6|nr:lantibiotic dehydratase [Staphylococcus agnetis]SUJ98568.1 thiopeptide-type bacteriocin biosynthesis domain protein [Staphylococcus agnetis]
MDVFEKYMYRSPLLPMKSLKDIQKNNLTDREYVEFLIGFVEKHNLYANIYSSSKSLYYSIKNFGENTSEKKTKSILISLYKYLLRMSTRPTPFGMLSGVGINDLNEDVIEPINESIHYSPYFNNSLLYLCIDYIHSDDSILNKSTIYVNPLLYKDKTHVFLPYQVTYNVEKLTSPENISLRRNTLVDRVLELCAEKIIFKNLKTIIMKEFSAEEKIVTDYLKNLVKEDFLLTNFKLRLHEKNASQQILQELENIGECNDNVYILIKKIYDNIIKIKNDDNKVGILNTFIESDEVAKKLFPNFQENAINIDTKIENRYIQITDSDIKNINFIATLISQLSAFKPSKVLEDYKNKFSEFYGQDEDVKLIELLNSNIGLGLPKEYFSERTNTDLNNLDKFNSISKILEEWKTEALINGENIINLTDNKLQKLQQNIGNHKVNASYDLYFTTFNRKDGKLYLKNNSGSLSANQTYGRFIYMFGESLNKHIQKFSSTSISQNVEVLDINYNHPNTRIQNVMTSTTNKDSITLVDFKSKIKDLYVFLGEDFNFYIKDKNTQKIIIPNFNNMHNTDFAPSIIRFLSDISLQYSTGGLFLDFSMLGSVYSPRIEYRNIVLCPQKWNVNLKKNLNFNSFFEFFNEFSHSYKLPEKFYIIKDDHKLYLNLKHELSKVILYQEYKKRDVIEIEELECEFSNKENTYIDEVVFSFSNYEPPRISDIQSLKNLRNTKEIKLPYEEWLCFNLYYNDYDIDKFLSDGIYKTIFTSLNRTDINTIFFIRYFDEKPHIRLRFKLKSNNVQLKEKILNLMYHFIYENYIASFTIVPYIRETYRYGGPNSIDLAEKCFEIDSLIVAKYYNKLQNDIDIFDFAVDNILEILMIFFDDIDNCIKALEVVEKKKENKNFYREKRERVLDSIRNNQRYLTKYKIQNERLEYYTLYKESIDISLYSITSIVLSVIHMFCNRLFGIDRQKEDLALELISRALKDYKKIKGL